MGTSNPAWRSCIAALVFALSLASPAVSAPLIGHGSNATMYDLDLDSGAALNPRDVGTAPLVGISLSNDGVLFGLGFNQRVFTIDPIAGTSQSVGLLGFAIGEGDIAFDPTTGSLYGLAFVDADSARHLFTIDTETGEGTDVGAIPVASLDPSAMVFDDAGAFLVSGIPIAVDGTDPDLIENIMLNDLETIEGRHAYGKAIFNTIGRYAPAFGMIGTLIGLVIMLKNMNDPSSIGPAMAVALLTTMYGAILANLIALPMADKLGLRSREEILVKLIMIKGVMAIQSGDNPRIVEHRDASSSLARATLFKK